ncbi:MAG: 30S ribosomal protein S15 [Oligoflexia bacterium]|nr:30S ribosomal protein S15 [Oligoflexia bacterium]
MAISKQTKQSVIKKHRRSELDTGSPEVQIALLTTRINELTDHFKTHTKDVHSRRGLLKIVGQRRKLLEYLKKNNSEKYKTLISELGIRK